MAPRPLPGPDKPPVKKRLPSDPRTIDAALVRLPYHPDTPPQAARGRAAGRTLPSPGAMPAPRGKPPAAVAKKAGRAVTATGRNALNTLTSQPALGNEGAGPPRPGQPGFNNMGLSLWQAAGNAPMPAPLPGPTPAPVPVAAPVAPAGPADPYAHLPPEVAMLLRSSDQRTTGQADALQRYYGDQAGSAERFAQTLAPQLQGLAQIAGISPAPGAGAGVPGSLAALSPQLSKIGGQMLGAQGFDIANAAAMTPGFLRQAGQGSLAELYGAAAEGTGDILSAYQKSAGELDVAGLQQETEREKLGGQIQMNEADNRVSANNAKLNYLGTLLRAAIDSGDSAAVNEVRSSIAATQAETQRLVAETRAGATTSAAQIRADAARAATAAAAADKAKKAKTPKPASPGTRTAVANAFRTIWEGPDNPLSGRRGVAVPEPPPPANAPPAVDSAYYSRPEVKAATNATVSFLKRYNKNFPGAAGLAELLALIPADAAQLARRWFYGQQKQGTFKKAWP
jgi:hypothetical protein